MSSLHSRRPPGDATASRLPNVVASQNSDAPPAPYYVKGLALGIPPYLVAVHLWTWVFTLPVFLAGNADFRQLYAAAYIVRTGHATELYQYDVQKAFQDKFVSPEQMALPFVSPAYQALVFAPLSYLRYRNAYGVFLLLNIGMLALVFLLLYPWMRHLRSIYIWLPYALFLGFLPIAAALIQGQDSIILTALLTGTFVCLTKGWELPAGVLTGTGLFKFSMVLPLALLFVFWKRTRFLLGFAISATVLSTLSVWLTGVAQTKHYLRSLLAIAGFATAPSGLARYPISLQAMANLHGLFFGVFGSHFRGLSLHLLTAIVSAMVFVWTIFRGSRTTEASNLLLLAIPCSVLVGHHTYIHDLSVLLIPTVVMLGSFITSENKAYPKLPNGGSTERARALRTARFINRSAGVMFVAPLVESFCPDCFYLVCIAVILLLWAAACMPSTRRSLCKA